MLHDPAVYPNPEFVSPEHIPEKGRNETPVDLLSVLDEGQLSLSPIAFREHEI
jgi:hypothetical protein